MPLLFGNCLGLNQDFLNFTIENLRGLVCAGGESRKNALGGQSGQRTVEGDRGNAQGTDIAGAKSNHLASGGATPTHSALFIDLPQSFEWLVRWPDRVPVRWERHSRNFPH